MRQSQRVCSILFAAWSFLALCSPQATAQDMASDEATEVTRSPAIKLNPYYRTPITLRGGNLLYDNGPLVNNPGGGLGGADESVVQGSLGMTSFGFNHDPEEFRVSDDFTVSDTNGWTIDSLVFYAYQTFSGNASTITRVSYQIWDGPPNDPGSSVVFGDLITDRLIETVWSNVYRVSEGTSGGNTDRPIMKNTVSAGTTLAAGTYWIDWVTEGTLTSGPWAPPITINGQTTTGNALQHTEASGTWANVMDAGTSAQQGFPFLIYGPGVPPGDITVSVTLSPTSGDGSFDYTAEFTNNTDSSLTVDIWLEMFGPEGHHKLGQVVTGKTLLGGHSYSRTGDQQLGMNAPDGDYTFVANVGTYPVAIASGNAAYTKSTGLPAIGFSPASMQFTLAPGQVDSMLMTITNAGGGTLEFTLSDEDVGARRRAGVVPERVEPEMQTELPKGASEARHGEPQVEGAGGPDTFGHVWIDSDEPGGPSFNWTDITGSGMPVILGDDAFLSVPLPFTFSYYGAGHTAVSICSNGYLTFTSSGTDFSNDPIPSSLGDDDLIAGFWDDLDPSVAGGGTIHYLGSSTEFIVQYTDVEHYLDPSSLSTFQIILYPSGEMLFQYLSMTGTLNSSTIGIENVDGTDGLQVVYNAEYVHDNLAVRTYVSSMGDDSPWLSENPTSGSIPPGGSAEVQIRANSTGLAPGDYNANVIVSSNDPNHPDTTMPVTLTVLGNDPEISVSPTSIEETLGVGDSTDVTITISNVGLSNLIWSAAITSSSLNGTTVSDKKIELTTKPSFLARSTSGEGAVGRPSEPPVQEGGVILILDDGSIENDVGIGGGQWLWLNRFTPDASEFPFALNEVQILFDAGLGVDVGEIVDIYLYEDTDGDGDPGTSAVHLSSLTGAAVQAADGITWSVYSMPPIDLSGPGDVLIAVATRTAGTNADEYPAAIDQTASQVRSWAGLYTAGNPPDPPPLPADLLWGEIGGFGIPGNWMIRGFGSQGGGGGSEWISFVGNRSGTITPGNSADLIIRLRAGDIPRTYDGTIEITSNDLANPSIAVPVTLTVTEVGPEPLMSLTHTPGNLNMGIFNDGSIGADNQGFVGPGITWRGNNGCFVGGPIFGTTARASVNGLVGSFSVFGDIINVASNFAGGFTSDANFSQIASADLDDSGAPVPYGVGILQRSYTNTDEEFGLIRYGYVNNTASTLADFYAGIFTDWDVAPFATNSGGVDEDRNLIYTFSATGTIAYFGLAALDGNIGGRTTTASPPATTREGSFDWITMLDLTILPNGDFREWIGTGPVDIGPGDTAWTTFAVLAGDDLAGLQANADAARAKAIVVGWVPASGATGIEGLKEELPKSFDLAQNYPNPFNPTTRIKYALPEQSSVSLKIYNILGQEIITLSTRLQEAAYYEVSWDGRNAFGALAGSGVYIYRLEARGASGKTFLTQKKMIYLR